MALGQQEEAAAVLAEYLRLHPNTAEAYVLKAEKSTAAGSALGILEAGMARFPRATILYTEAARWYERLPDANETATRLHRIREIAAAQESAVGERLAAIALRDHYLRHRLYPEAEPLCRQLLTPQARGHEWETLGLTLLTQGKWMEAAEAYGAAATAHAGDPLSDSEALAKTLTLQGLALLATGETAGAATARERFAGVARATADGGARRSVAREAFAVWAGAVPLHSNRLQYRPGDEQQMRVWWGKTLHAARGGILPDTPLLPTDARRALLETVVGRHPDCYPARYELAQLLAEEGVLAAALAHLQAARGACPNGWAPRWALADYYYGAGRHDAARQELQRVTQLAPGLREATTLLARLAAK